MFTPWNLYPACPIDKNGYTGIECVNLSKPGVTVPPGFTPWNEILPKKYLFPGIPVVTLSQNPCNPSYSIPLGPAPWNFDSGCPIDINGRIEIESFNLLKPGEAIPLGPAPWNEICAVKLRKWGKFSFLSEKGTFQGYQAIPLGSCQLNIAFSFEL